MIHRTLVLLALAGVTSTLGCQERGVSLGSDELCRADPALEAAARSSALSVPAGSSLQASTCARIGENALQDPGFETPKLNCTDGLYCQFKADEVDGWETSSAEQVIEIWRDQYMDVPSPEGSQFAELNASAQDTLWQDIALPPGQLMYWAFRHHGRIGIESIEVRIGPSDAPVSQGIFGAGIDAWVTHRGLYRVGEGEALTRFALASRSGEREANLIDAVELAPVE